VAACSEVCSASAVAAHGGPGPSLKTLPAQTQLLAWIRRRSGTDCDFAAVFEELFASRDPVGAQRFGQVLAEKGFQSDHQAAFSYLDRVARRGAVGAAEFEAWQNEVEDRESEGLKHLRDFLKCRHPTPSAAYRELGKGEGDVLTLNEFKASMNKVGFTADNPEELFRFMDKDFSGEVNFAEFKTVMRNAGHKQKRSPRAQSPPSNTKHKAGGAAKR